MFFSTRSVRPLVLVVLLAATTWNSCRSEEIKAVSDADESQESSSFSNQRREAAYKEWKKAILDEKKIEFLKLKKTRSIHTMKNPSNWTPPKKQKNAECEDTEGWHDSMGTIYDCEWYANDEACEWYGNDYENYGMTANQACCVCGGGSESDNHGDIYETYDFFPHVDSYGNDIGYITPSEVGGLQDIKEACDDEPGCVAFNSNGWIKFAVTDENDWYEWTQDSSKGLYVKKGKEKCGISQFYGNSYYGSGDKYCYEVYLAGFYSYIDQDTSGGTCEENDDEFNFSHGLGYNYELIDEPNTQFTFEGGDGPCRNGIFRSSILEVEFSPYVAYPEVYVYEWTMCKYNVILVVPPPC